MLRRPTRIRLQGERGFTLIETLVAIVVSLVVSFAAFSILDISLSQSARIADRVSADQRGRVAMENIILTLHTSCVAPETTPVEVGSTENKLLIVSQSGSQASFTKVALHEIAYTEEGKGNGKLVDTSYPNTEAKPAPNWEFSKTPSASRTLLTGVSRSENSLKEAIPIFRYYKYEGVTLSESPLETPLTLNEANETAAIAIGITVASESGNTGRKSGERTVDLANTVVLRFSPASAVGTNFPCT